MKRYRRILHPTDFSRPSEAAFSEALALAKQDRAELVLVHVIEPRGLVLGKAYHAAETYQIVARHEAEQQLAAEMERTRRAGVRSRALVVTGQAFDEIVAAAERERAELIVLGTHGRTGARRFLMGSVASRVLQLAPCPVLTVRAGASRGRPGRT